MTPNTILVLLFVKIRNLVISSNLFLFFSPTYEFHPLLSHILNGILSFTLISGKFLFAFIFCFIYDGTYCVSFVNCFFLFIALIPRVPRAAYFIFFTHFVSTFVVQMFFILPPFLFLVTFNYCFIPVITSSLILALKFSNNIMFFFWISFSTGLYSFS